jgi:hypothetical protein
MNKFQVFSEKSKFVAKIASFLTKIVIFWQKYQLNSAHNKNSD